MWRLSLEPFRLKWNHVKRSKRLKIQYLERFRTVRHGSRPTECALALLAAIVAVVTIAPQPADAQGRIAGRHGDWQIRCEQPVGSPSEQCALVQNVEAQDRANVSLTVIFLRTADRQARILRVLAPLGVLLPSGLGLTIDETEVGLAGFVRCAPEGCIAEVELDDGLLERFGAGTTATFVIFQTPEEGIGIPISLNGFTEGFAALDSPPAPAQANVGEPAIPSEGVPTTVAQPIEDRFTVADDALGEIDDRTELDRLLEDPLLPYVAASLVLVLGVIIIIALVLRGRVRKRRRAEDDEYDDVEDEPIIEAPRSRTRAPEGDDLDALQNAPQGGRGNPRLAASPRPRQLPKADGSAPRAPGAPRAPRR